MCGFWLPEFATFSRTKGQSQLSAGKQPPYTEQKRSIEMSQFVRKGLLLVPFHRDSRCLMLRVFAPAITSISLHFECFAIILKLICKCIVVDL